MGVTWAVPAIRYATPAFDKLEQQKYPPHISCERNQEHSKHSQETNPDPANERVSIYVLAPRVVVSHVLTHPPNHQQGGNSPLPSDSRILASQTLIWSSLSADIKYVLDWLLTLNKYFFPRRGLTSVLIFVDNRSKGTLPFIFFFFSSL